MEGPGEEQRRGAEPDRSAPVGGAGRDPSGAPAGSDGGRRPGTEGAEPEGFEEDPTAEVAGLPGDDGADVGMLRLRMEAKDRHVRDLYDEVAALRVERDEAEARARAAEERIRGLEEERGRLRELVRGYEEEERRRRRRREGVDRRIGRLEREIERREEEISRLGELLDRREGEMDLYGREAEDVVSRKDVALRDALRRVEGLERDLEERESEAAELRATVGELRAELDLEYELRRRMAEPANRLRAGIDLFNASEHARAVASISRSLGAPEVRVDLAEEDGEPPVILKFLWRGGAPSLRVYLSNPGLAVEEPRVYLQSADDAPDLTRRDLPNARTDVEGRVSLGL